jgi:hypothetical protein
MADSEATLNNSGGKTSCFMPFWTGKLADKCLPIRTLLYVSFKHLFINLTRFMGTPKYMRIMYSTSLLSESKAFLKSMNS